MNLSSAREADQELYEASAERTLLEPGTYIDSHWGHYQSARTIELARELGWQPKRTSDPSHTPEQEAAYVDALTVTYLQEGNVDNLDVWYDIVNEAEDYINEHHVDEDHWFGHHPDLGDVGVWPMEDDL